MFRLLKSIFLISFILFFCSIFVFAEDITITTYYPSPYGSYNFLQTDKLGVGDNDGVGGFTSADVPVTSGEVWIKGSVGIGTTAPLAPIHVNGGTAMSWGWNRTAMLSAVYPVLVFNSNSSKYAGIGYDYSSNFNIWVNASSNDVVTGSRALSITQTADVGIGVTPTYKLQLNGQPAANGYTAWTNYSDRRLKENIKGVEGGMIEKIMKLKPSTFNYNEKYYQITGYNKEDHKLCGFVAQEIQEVFPEMVKERQIGKESYLDTNLTNLQIYLVKAIQEQQDIVKAQQLDINGLKARLDKLEERK